MSSRRLKSRLFRFHLVLWGISVQWSRSLWLWVSNSNLFCWLLCRLKCLDHRLWGCYYAQLAEPLKACSLKIWDKEWYQTCQQAFWSVFENCERWCLIMKIPGFRSACSCLYSKGRCGWWFPELSDNGFHSKRRIPGGCPTSKHTMAMLGGIPKDSKGAGGKAIFKFKLGISKT